MVIPQKMLTNQAYPKIEEGDILKLSGPLTIPISEKRKRMIWITHKALLLWNWIPSMPIRTYLRRSRFLKLSIKSKEIIISVRRRSMDMM